MEGRMKPTEIAHNVVLGRRSAKWRPWRIWVLSIPFFALLAPGAAGQAANPYQPQFRHFTADFGGGWTWARGGSTSLGVVFHAGAGLRLSPADEKRFDDNGNPIRDRHWSLYLIGDFMFNQSPVTSKALAQAIQLNPQITGLSSATAATQRYYTASAGPTFRYCWRDCTYTVYGLGGLGWMHRNVDFTGVPQKGSPIGLQNPSVAGFDYDSVAYDWGAGVAFGPFKPIEGATFFIELRRLQGVASNDVNALWPLSIGVRW